MELKKLTWKADIEPHDPCFKNPPTFWQNGMTILDILHHPKISDQDKLWAFSRKGIVPERAQRMFACKCCRDTPLNNGKVLWGLLEDERSRKAVEVAERFANGEATQEELKAAADAAHAASRAADAVARSAYIPYRAAWAAACAAHTAARVARTAAWGLADYAQAAQVRFAIEIIESELNRG